MSHDDLAEILLAKTSGTGKARAAIAMAIAVQRGLPKKALDNVKQELGLSDERIAVHLGMSTKTLGRLRMSAGHLDLVTSDRLYRLARIFELAREVLEDDDLAREWLSKPQIGLGNEVPLDLTATEAGAREVEDLLGRIEFGVLS